MGRPKSGKSLKRVWCTPEQAAAIDALLRGAVTGTEAVLRVVAEADGELSHAKEQLRLQTQRADQLQADVDAKVAYVEKHGWDNAAVAYWKRKYEEGAGATRNSEFDQTA